MARLEVFNSIVPQVNQSFFGWEELQVIICPNSMASNDFVDWARGLPRKSQRIAVSKEVTRVVIEDMERDEVGRRREEKEFEMIHGVHQDFMAISGGRSILEFLLDEIDKEDEWQKKVKKTKGSRRFKKISDKGKILYLHGKLPPDSPTAS